MPSAPPCARAGRRSGSPRAWWTSRRRATAGAPTWRPGGNGSRRTVHAAAVVLAAGGGLRGEADALGVGSTNHPDATPEVLRLALELGAEGRELDSWQRHPTGSVWPEALAGYALPETTRATARRCTTPTASASSTSSPRATSWPRRSSTPLTRAAAHRPRRQPRRVARHRRHRPRERRRVHRRAPRLRPQALYQGGRGHHPRARAGVPRAPLPQRRARDRRARRHVRCPASSPRARSPGGSTAPTG